MSVGKNKYGFGTRFDLKVIGLRIELKRREKGVSITDAAALIGCPISEWTRKVNCENNQFHVAELGIIGDAWAADLPWWPAIQERHSMVLSALSANATQASAPSPVPFSPEWKRQWIGDADVRLKPLAPPTAATDPAGGDEENTPPPVARGRGNRSNK